MSLSKKIRSRRKRRGAKVRKSYVNLGYVASVGFESAVSAVEAEPSATNLNNLLFEVSELSNEKPIMSTPIIDVLDVLLGHDDPKVVSRVLDIIGAITTINTEATVLTYRLVPKIKLLARVNQAGISEDVYWVLSNAIAEEVSICRPVVVENQLDVFIVSALRDIKSVRAFPGLVRNILMMLKNMLVCPGILSQYHRMISDILDEEFYDRQSNKLNAPPDVRSFILYIINYLTIEEEDLLPLWFDLVADTITEDNLDIKIPSLLIIGNMSKHPDLEMRVITETNVLAVLKDLLLAKDFAIPSFQKLYWVLSNIAITDTDPLLEQGFLPIIFQHIREHIETERWSHLIEAMWVIDNVVYFMSNQDENYFYVSTLVSMVKDEGLCEILRRTLEITMKYNDEAGLCAALETLEVLFLMLDESVFDDFIDLYRTAGLDEMVLQVMGKEEYSDSTYNLAASLDDMLHYKLE